MVRSAEPQLEPVTMPSGVVHRRVESFPLSLRRGRYEIGAAHGASVDDVTALCSATDVPDLDGALYLDTETTGLRGGAGTFVFLLGVASFVGDRFEVRQWVLPDPADEEAFLDALAVEAEGASRLVSFHGRGFDAPRLEERCLLHGRAFPLAGLPHLDLLIGARRVFRARVGGARLENIERHVLGIERLDDLPGAECPEAWYDYLRGNGAPMDRVLEHNLQDLLSLPPLVAALGDAALGDGPAEDLHGAGRAFSRAGAETRALDLQRSAAERARDRGLAACAHEEASRLLRRRGEPDEAAAEAMAATRADPDRPGPWLALAKHAEHRSRDYELALLCTRELERIVAAGDVARRLREDVVRRRARIERKSARAR